MKKQTFLLIVTLLILFGCEDDRRKSRIAYLEQELADSSYTDTWCAQKDEYDALIRETE